MEKSVEHGLLYDFYGELLTEHQQQIYEDAVYNDMSLAEIADIQGISRQGVHDLLKRCDRILEGYEQKLHLVERFGRVKERVLEIEALTDELGMADSEENSVGSKQTVVRNGQDEKNAQDRIKKIRELLNEILGEL